MLEIYQYRLIRNKKIYFLISIPREFWNHEKFFYYSVKNHKMIVYFEKPNDRVKKRKINLIGNKQPAIYIPKRCVDEELYLPQAKDKIFITIDKIKRNLIIHFDWNQYRVQQLLELNHNQSINQLCNSFSEGINPRDPKIVQFVKTVVQSITQ